MPLGAGLFVWSGAGGVSELDIEYMILAGGGSGGMNNSYWGRSGGGGGGGWRSSMTGESSGYGSSSVESALLFTKDTTYTVNVGLSLIHI